jgi:arabinofuranan 3-O-arabinosyltransferase
MWVALAVVTLALPFLSLPGRYVFDTRDHLWFDPAHYLSRAIVLWRASPYLGHEQHDGIAVPMGLVVWLLRSGGLSPWGAERVWHGLLLFTAAGGTVLLVDHFKGRRTVAAPLTAALLYALTPYSFGYGLQFSAVFLPYVLLPLLLLATLRGLEDKRLLWPALFGLITFLMGGGNGAPQVYLIVVTAALALWVVFLEHGASLGRAVRFGAWSLLFVIGLNAYWLFLLGSNEVSNALLFSEQPAVINVSSSFSEAIRGLGFWQYYGGDQFGPWIPAVRTYVTSVPLIAAGFAIPVAAFASAWLVRWRHRLFFVLAGIIGVIVSAGVFPTPSPTPFGRALLWAYNHVPGAAGLRTTYKITSLVNLAFAVLAAMGVAALWSRLGSTSRGTMRRAGLALLIAVVVGANSYALVSGRLYNPAHGVKDVPGYWGQALARLDQRDVKYRAFFAPTTSWRIYRWGAFKEGVEATDPRLSYVTPLRLPVGQRYGSNLVTALEQPYFYGLPAGGSAELFRYLGVRDVVLQNDLNWQQSHTARPASLQTLLHDPDLDPFASFGRPGENVVGSGSARDPVAGKERLLTPVQVLTVADPEPIVRAESGDPVVISGDGFGLAAAARRGLLPGGPPVLYSGSLTPAQLQAVVSEGHPSFVITDSNRRRVWSFTGPRAPYSYTYPAGQTQGAFNPGFLLFDSRIDTQSVAVYPGVRAITASGYGSAFGLSPQFRPANAFDGDSRTWWEVGAGRDLLGAWVQATFTKPVRLSRVSIAFPRSPSLREVRRVRLQFSDGRAVLALVRPGRPVTINFPARITRILRVRLVSLGPDDAGRRTGVGIADIKIPGLNPAEIIQVPSDLVTTAEKAPAGLASLSQAPLTYLFERARTGIPGRPDEETGISRRFEVPNRRAFDLTGTVRLNRSASDLGIDGILNGPTDVHVSGSSRLFDNPVLRGSAAFDGNRHTSWVPAGGVGQSLSIAFPRRGISRLSIHTDAGPDRTRIQQLTVRFSDGSIVVANVRRPDGVVRRRFPARKVTGVVVTITSIGPQSNPRKPVGISEVVIPGVQSLGATPGSPLPCTAGSTYSLDGRPIQIRPVGSAAGLLSGAPLRLETCGRKPVELTTGWHNLVARGALRPDLVEFATGTPADAGVEPAGPSIDFSQRSDGGFQVDVKGATQPFYLVIGQNFSPKWRASIGGDDLGSPILLDGYSAGWRLTRTGDYTISVVYGPQRLYQAVLLVTAASVVAVIVVIGVSLLRRRRVSGR